MKKLKTFKFNWYKLLSIAFLLFLLVPQANIVAVVSTPPLTVTSNKICNKGDIICLIKTGINKTGNFLTSVSDDLADGWVLFTDGILNDTEKFIDSLSSKPSSNLAIEITHPILPQGKVETSQNTITKILTPTRVIERIVKQSTSSTPTIINQYDPTVFPRLLGVEKAIENLNNRINNNTNDNFSSRQIDAIYDSLGNTIDSSSRRITEGGTLNDSILNSPILNNATITGTLSGNAGTVTNGVYTSRTINGHPLSSDVTVTASDVNLGNVTNESKATMFTSPTFTGTVEITNLPTVNGGTLTTALNLSGTNTGDDAVNSLYSGLASSKQDALNGTGFVKISGTTISYDNSTYLTTNSASGTYLPLAGGTMTGGITNSTSINPLTTLAESWIGPSSTNGIYFKDGNVGITTTTPAQKLDVAGNVNISSGSAYMYNGVNIIRALTASSNYFFGNGGNLTMTGIYNTAVGKSALISNTSGYQNVAVGGGSLYDNTTGYLNVGIGINVLTYNDVGTYNTGIGANSLYTNSGGSYNTAVGTHALYYNTTGSYNTAVGNYSLTHNVTGINNTAMGYYSFLDLNEATGTGNNTAIGYNTGRGITTGINNTIIGANVTGLAAGLSNRIIIADGSGNQRIYVDNTGLVGIGTTTPASHLQIGGNLSASSWTTTGIAFDSNAATYTDTSTAAAGTVAVRTANSFGAPTFASTNAITVTDAFSLYVPKPIAGANTTITRANSAYFEGNVGIGTTSPGRLLEVNGISRFDDRIYLTSSENVSLAGSVSDIKLNGYNTADSATYTIMTLVRGSGAGNTGNVGIGTTTPASHLQIGGNLSASSWTTTGIAFDSNAATYTDTSTAAAGTVAVRTANSFGAPTFASTNAITVTDAFSLYVPKPIAGANTTITNANSAYFEGNVGIGTTSPATSLHIASTNKNIGGNVFGNVYVATTDSEAIDKGGSISFGGVYTGTTTTHWAGIAGKKENSTNGQYGGYLNFYTRANGLAPAEVMRITSAGNVGIGTTTPTANLQVAQVTAGAGTVTITGNTTCTGTGTQFTNTFKVGDNIIITATSETRAISAIASDTVMTIASATNTVDSAYTLTGGTRFSVLGNGNVGIGTTTPGNKLTVTGGHINISDGSYGYLIANDTALSRNSGNLKYGTASSYTSQSFFISGVEKMTINSSGNLGVGTTTPASHLQIGGNLSASSWTTTGIAFDSNAATYTDTSTAAAGTVAVRTANSFGAPTFASTNAITVTDAFSLYVPKPIAGANTTITRANSAYFEGNVGIGTTTPGNKLTVTGGHINISDASYGYLLANDTALIRNAGNLKYGTSSNYTSQSFFISGVEKMTINSSGNLGIGTTTPTTFKLQVAGDVGPDANNSYNLGAAGSNWGCLYYNGGTQGTCASDQRLKTNISDLTFGTDPLSQIANLRPRSFSFTSDPNASMYNGLIAQEVEQFAPELVITNTDGYKAIKYGDIQWLTLEAIKQMNLKLGDLSSLDTTSDSSLGSLIKNFLADVGNGIEKIFVREVNTDTLCVSDSTGAKTCINKAELDSLLAGAGASTLTPTPVPPTPDTTPTPESPLIPPVDEIPTCTDTQTLVDNVCVDKIPTSSQDSSETPTETAPVATPDATQ